MSAIDGAHVAGVSCEAGVTATLLKRFTCEVARYAHTTSLGVLLSSASILMLFQILASFAIGPQGLSPGKLKLQCPFLRNQATFISYAGKVTFTD